jgi:hypothetical protein
MLEFQNPNILLGDKTSFENDEAHVESQVQNQVLSTSVPLPGARIQTTLVEKPDHSSKSEHSHSEAGHLLWSEHPQANVSVVASSPTVRHDKPNTLESSILYLEIRSCKTRCDTQ